MSHASHHSHTLKWSQISLQEAVKLVKTTPLHKKSKYTNVGSCSAWLWSICRKEPLLCFCKLQHVSTTSPLLFISFVFVFVRFGVVFILRLCQINDPRSCLPKSTTAKHVTDKQVCGYFKLCLHSSKNESSKTQLACAENILSKC